MLALTLLPTRPLVVAYVPNFRDMTGFEAKIDYAKVTHLNVAFENPADDDGDLSTNSFDEVLVKAAHEHGVKVLVSIGGGGASGDKELLKRYFYLTSPSRRAGFVRKLSDYVTAHGFDGLDVDLEGPSINGDYGPFVRDLGRSLHAAGKTMTSALSVGYGGDQVPNDALKAFDLVNVMAYDATGPWAPDRPGPHSSLQLAKDNVAYWTKRGLPKAKIVLGVPFYGYGFGPAAGGDEWSFARIVAAYPGAENADVAGTTVYYNGLPTMRAKARYVLDQGLAGVMIWSLDSDAPGDKSLLGALDAALNPRR